MKELLRIIWLVKLMVSEEIEILSKLIMGEIINIYLVIVDTIY